LAAGAAASPAIDPASAAPPKEDSPALERAIRIGAVLVSVVAALVTAILELDYSAVRIGGVLIGLSVLLAVAANYAISWFVVTTTGRNWTLAPAAIVWTLFMMFIAGHRTTEGDYLLSGSNWVGLVLILAGSLTFAVYAYRMILRGPSVTKQ
jgi:hypothetical protein